MYNIDPISNEFVIFVFVIALMLGLAILIWVSMVLQNKTTKYMEMQFQDIEKRLPSLGQQVIEENEQEKLVVSLINDSTIAPESFRETSEWIVELSFIVQKFMGALGHHKDKIFKAPHRVVLNLSKMEYNVINLIHESGVAL